MLGRARGWNCFGGFHSKALPGSVESSRGWTRRKPQGVDRKGMLRSKNPGGGSAGRGLLVVSTERTPARPARLTQATELHGRAAQLEGFSDQARLRAVHVRGTQVKIVQQALDAPGGTSAGNPAHAAYGERAVRWAPWASLLHCWPGAG